VLYGRVAEGRGSKGRIGSAVLAVDGGNDRAGFLGGSTSGADHCAALRPLSWPRGFQLESRCAKPGGHGPVGGVETTG
jgi:hypothetical protein